MTEPVKFDLNTLMEYEKLENGGWKCTGNLKARISFDGKEWKYKKFAVSFIDDSPEAASDKVASYLFSQLYESESDYSKWDSE